MVDIDKIIDIIASFLEVDSDDIDENTDILYEYDLDEDQLEELADIITEETGHYVSADMIESSSVIKNLIREIEDY